MPFLARPLHDIVFGLVNARKVLIKLLPFLSSYIKEVPTLWLMNRIQAIVDVRNKSPSKRVDLLQLMLDASTQDEVKVGIFIYLK